MYCVIHREQTFFIYIFFSNCITPILNEDPNTADAAIFILAKIK